MSGLRLFDSFSRHAERRDSLLHSATLDEPFVPYVGADYFDASPRLMIVGAALAYAPSTGETESPRSLAPAPTMEQRFLTSLAWTYTHVSGLEDRRASAFWRFVRRAIGVVHPRTPNWRDRLVWTNLAKVAQADRTAPEEKVAEAFWREDAAALRSEIDLFAPDLIVALSANHCLNAAYDVFGRGAMFDRGPDDRMWVRQLGSAKLLWTYHPQGKGGAEVQGWLDRLARFCS